jgi:GT2 family glycosyltransferase
MKSTNTCGLLIPCYNASKYLPRLWETVKAQTIPFDEIICYDDGSNDNTVDIAQSLGLKVILGNEQKGVSHARNQLAKASQCSWIHFHDADDILDPKYLEKAKARINDNIDIIVCNVDWVEEQSRRLLIAWRYEKQSFENRPLISAIDNPIGVINVLCRKDNFLSVGGFEESSSCWEDADLYVRLAAAGSKFTVINEVLCLSLRHPGGLSENQHKCWKCRLNFLKTYSHDFCSSVNEVIIDQLELVARNFLLLKDNQLALEAIKFSQKIGGHPPKTNNALLNLFKSIVPAFYLLQIQHYVRNNLINK